MNNSDIEAQPMKIETPPGLRGDMPLSLALELFRHFVGSNEEVYVPDQLCQELDINPIKANGSKSLKEIVAPKKISTRERLLKKLEEKHKEA